MEIVPGIHQVDGVNGNSYIIAREKLTIIDTGLPGSGKKILAYIKDEIHRNPQEIEAIVITHYHMDHTGGIKAIRAAAPGAKIAVHQKEADYVSGKIQPPIHKGLRGVFLRLVTAVMNPGFFSPDIILNDGDQIGDLVCVYLPGHTSGSIGLLDKSARAFFCGDTLRSDGNHLLRGPEQFTMDLKEETQSLEKIASLDFDILLVGHGVPLKSEASEKVREFVKKISVTVK